MEDSGPARGLNPQPDHPRHQERHRCSEPTLFCATDHRINVISYSGCALTASCAQNQSTVVAKRHDPRACGESKRKGHEGQSARGRRAVRQAGSRGGQRARGDVRNCWHFPRMPACRLLIRSEPFRKPARQLQMGRLVIWPNYRGHQTHSSESIRPLPLRSIRVQVAADQYSSLDR